jgi:dUTP pyrophosphatase
MINIDDRTLYFAKVRDSAIIPSKDPGNAGYDIYADIDKPYFKIASHETRLVPTGIASAMSPRWYLQVEERGSTGSKGIKKSAGVIDSSYRGEIFIAITNVNQSDLYITDLSPEELKKTASIDNDSEIIIYPLKKAIAQLVLHEVPDVAVREISYEELREIPSDRGEGRLGSSGK